MEGNFPRASGRIRGLARTPAAAWATPLASRTTKRRHPTIGLLVPAAIVALAATRAGDVDAQLPVHATADASREWSGWYAGGHVGYRPGSATVTLSDSRPMWSSHGFGSLDAGAFLGYNRVLSSRLLLGTEADVSFPHFFEDGTVASGTAAHGSTVTEKLDFVSTLRGRFGYVSDRWLFYGTGGFAPSQMRFIEAPVSSSHPDTRRAAAHGLGMSGQVQSWRSHRAGLRVSSISSTDLDNEASSSRPGPASSQD